ncbi:hypothetical protein Rhom172_2443 [Rhodothermus marinus SG0.5JP17-172]|uniref:T9SS type A sorting domain-containing protein n=1 Tax=Rhodothermus marinus TaxID=29549 RepID=UPI000223DDCA|nr:T9SS type A sorting domain-containing protein [Rhodothermus marinus]AEN74336.1 hypothetical protein Rhom172_2443 [Rhodothermus marinus SG0.5JP17-172]
MQTRYYLTGVLLVGLLAVARPAAAQDYTVCPTDQDECVVEWADENGLPLMNALTNTVANDTERPAGRIYKLKRGGFYWITEHISNNEFDLRLIGQTAEEGAATGENVCGESGTEDCGPAIIQRFRREDGTVDGLMIESSGDGNGGLELRNLWLMGQDDSGVTANYEPILINSKNSKFIFDHVVFDRNDWHHLSFKAEGNDIIITNCLFRNLVGPTQIWEGRAIRLEAGADTVIFENNSFFNLTSFPFQSEAAPVEYFLFNHNTLVNFGRNFNAGGLWKRAYVTNNLMINPFWQGESEQQYQDRLNSWVGAGNDPDYFSVCCEHIGIFGIQPLPSRYGLETDRRIVLANNNWWLDPAVAQIHQQLGVRSQPLVSDTTARWFELYDGMVMENNTNLEVQLANAPTTQEVYNLMQQFISQWINEAPTPWALVVWDPGRDPDPKANIWPVPEDFSYSDPQLESAGTDGLPLGDLNWFPDALQDYLANRDAYIQAIEEMAGGAPEQPVDQVVVEGEDGAIENGSVYTYEGFVGFFFEGSGRAFWRFTVPEDGEYMLRVQTNMGNETERGQHIRIDGIGLQNTNTYGEFFFCSTNSTNAECKFKLQPNTWEWVEIHQSDLVAGSLTLTAGEHTLEIAPSWGWQWFSSVEVVQVSSGEVVATLSPANAEELTAARIECDDPEAFCPSGLQAASLDAGGSVTWTLEVPDNVRNGLARIFYQAETGATGTLLVDGQQAAELSFPAVTGTSASELQSPRFKFQTASKTVRLSAGTHTLTVTSASGGLLIDYVIVLYYESDIVATESSTLPEGYVLEQNYPNPFHKATTIRYTLPQPGKVRLVVYDLLGREVARLVDREMPAGTHAVRFEPQGLSSGLYFYRLETPEGQLVRRMTLLK